MLFGKTKMFSVLFIPCACATHKRMAAALCAIGDGAALCAIYIYINNRTQRWRKLSNYFLIAF